MMNMALERGFGKRKGEGLGKILKVMGIKHPHTTHCFFLWRNVASICLAMTPVSMQQTDE